MENPQRYRSSHLKSHLSTSVPISRPISVWQLRGALHAHQIHRDERGRPGPAGGERGRRRAVRQLLGWHPALQLRRHRGRPQVSQRENWSQKSSQCCLLKVAQNGIYLLTLRE